MNHRVAILGGAALSLLLLFVECRKNDQQLAVNILGPQLENMQKYWIKEGKPEDLQEWIKPYVRSSSERLFAFTNCFQINASNQRCLFAVQSSRFVDNGVLAITTDGTLLWVNPSNGIPIVTHRTFSKRLNF